MADLPLPTTLRDDDRTPRPVVVLGVVVLALGVVIGLTWAKWLPYAGKVQTLAGTRAWADPPILDAPGSVGLAGAWTFTTAYFEAVWRALLVAVLVAAGVDAFLPRRWLLRWAGTGSARRQAVVGALAAVPCMMCSCCAAPITVGLRRRGVPVPASVAFWLGNPLLNPAVLVFLALVLPWQFAAVRLGVGVAVVIGVASRAGAGSVVPVTLAEPAPLGSEATDWRSVGARFLRSVLRLVVVLVPEYVVVVFAVAAFTAAGGDFAAVVDHAGVLAVLAAAVVATVLVIPTGGEIPVLAALTALGTGGGVTGALLIALPAVSLPSVVMVGRSLGWRTTAGAVGAVLAGSLVAGAALAALT